MGPTEDRGTSDDEPLDELREVVPARAVLTELARGFLLAQATNPDRAVRFAATFLRECTGTPAPARIEATRPVTIGRRRLGTTDSGPVDPSSFPPIR
jgi:hypothetical protein